MRIIAISDCHGHMPVVPDCDLILNAGDICPDFRGGDRVMSQWQWMNGPYRAYLDTLPAAMIATWGNHDFVGERSEFVNTMNLPWTLLVDRLIEFNGLRIYGSPWCKRFYDWAFMRNETELDRIYRHLPEKLDILMVHGPPYQSVDLFDHEYLGSTALRRHIERAQPKLVICGHIHERAKAECYIGQTRVVNVCSLTRESGRRDLADVPYIEFDMHPD